MKELLQHTKSWFLIAALVAWAGAATLAEASPRWHKRCHGTGYIICHICHGEAEKNPAIHCSECRDTGKVKCPRCKGSGLLMTLIEIQKA